MDRVPAIFAQKACFLLMGRKFPLEFVFGPMTTFTQDEGFAFFHPGERNEKNLKVMIDAFVIGLVQTANRTTSGILVQNFRFWGYSEYKEHAVPVYFHFRGL
jgi:hypothetical protein